MTLQGRREDRLQGKMKVQDPGCWNIRKTQIRALFLDAYLFILNGSILKLHFYMKHLGLPSLDRLLLSHNP